MQIKNNEIVFGNGGRVNFQYTYPYGTTLETAITNTFGSLQNGNFMGDINVGGIEYFICGRKTSTEYGMMFIGGYYGVRKFAWLQEGKLTVVDM